MLHNALPPGAGVVGGADDGHHLGVKDIFPVNLSVLFVFADFQVTSSAFYIRFYTLRAV